MPEFIGMQEWEESTGLKKMIRFIAEDGLIGRFKRTGTPEPCISTGTGFSQGPVSQDPSFRCPSPWFGSVRQVWRKPLAWACWMASGSVHIESPDWILASFFESTPGTNFAQMQAVQGPPTILEGKWSKVYANDPARQVSYQVRTFPS